MNGPWMCAKIGCARLSQHSSRGSLDDGGLCGRPPRCPRTATRIVTSLSRRPSSSPVGYLVLWWPLSPAARASKGYHRSEVIPEGPGLPCPGAEPSSSSLSAEGLPPGEEDFWSPGRSLSGPVGIFPVAGIDVPTRPRRTPADRGHHCPPVMVVITRGHPIPEPPTLGISGIGLVSPWGVTLPNSARPLTQHQTYESCMHKYPLGIFGGRSVLEGIEVPALLLARFASFVCPGGLDHRCISGGDCRNYLETRGVLWV